MVGRKLSLVRAVLRNARLLKDPLAELVTAVRPCDTNGHLHQFRSYHATDMSKELQEWCLSVCRENMAALYDRVWTWSDVKKRKQLNSSASRFLIAHDAGAGRAPAGYVNYRFELEEGEPVLYCYELQIMRTAQSQGLGRALMQLLEQIAWASGMSKLMLTVFVNNVPAVSFYQKLGYQLDETSPDYCPGSGSCSPLGRGSAGGVGGSSSCSQEAGSACGGLESHTCSPEGGNDSGGSGGSSSAATSNASGGSEGTGAGYHILSKRASPKQQEQHQQQNPQAQQAQAQQPEDPDRHDNQALQGEKRQRTEDPADACAAAELDLEQKGGAAMLDGQRREGEEPPASGHAAMDMRTTGHVAAVAAVTVAHGAAEAVVVAAAGKAPPVEVPLSAEPRTEETPLPGVLPAAEMPAAESPADEPLRAVAMKTDSADVMSFPMASLGYGDGSLAVAAARQSHLQ